MTCHIVLTDANAICISCTASAIVQTASFGPDAITISSNLYSANHYFILRSRPVSSHRHRLRSSEEMLVYPTMRFSFVADGERSHLRRLSAIAPVLGAHVHSRK
jgi:hypothetical protein